LDTAKAQRWEPAEAKPPLDAPEVTSSLFWRIFAIRSVARTQFTQLLQSSAGARCRRPQCRLDVDTVTSGHDAPRTQRPSFHQLRGRLSRLPRRRPISG
jgi:hypothetical protein